MIIRSIKIENYKSIGESNNLLDFSPTVTAVIGKNESGKSNLLSAIGGIKPLYNLDASIKNQKTRGQDKDPGFTLELCFSAEEKNLFKTNDNPTFLTYGYTQVTIEGGLSDLIGSDEKLLKNIQEIKSKSDSHLYGLPNDQQQRLQTCIAQLLKLSSYIFSEYKDILKNIKTYIKNSSYADKGNELAVIDEIIENITQYYNLIPQIYYRNSDRTLKDKYVIEDIEKNQIVGDTIFHNLLKAAKINDDTIIKAIKTSDLGSKLTEQKKIQDRIKKNVSDIFNNYYTQEKIVFESSFESNSIIFYVYTENDAFRNVMTFSERSNGLKWYFSLFIDVISKVDLNRPVLYVLDEPGVYLHVNAQKELLSLFQNLCQKSGQVLYTTHSPFMLDSNDITNVRAIEKTPNGISKIYKSVYHHDLDKKSKLETLSPLIQAIGMELKYNIGPQFNKTNIVCEGITDYMYITSMLKALNVPAEKQPYIIPCTGVDNVDRVCSILIGWGYDFKVLLDYDAQGFSEYKKLSEKLLLKAGENLFFVNSIIPSNKNDVSGTNARTIESLIDSSDNEQLSTKFDGTTTTKTLAAKEFSDRLSKNEITLSDNTKAAFMKLFESIGL